MMQLDFFPELIEHVTRKEMDDLKTSCDKVRKGVFARHNELAGMYIELRNELDHLKESICRKK